MQQQEMLTAWSELQSRVEKAISLQLESHRRIEMSEGRAIKNRARVSPICDVAIASFACLFIGNFIADHFNGLTSDPITALPAIVLFAFSILLINIGVRQLILLSDLDYAKPIAEAQVKLAKLRKLRLHSTQWTFILALPTWFIFPILLGQMVIGIHFIKAITPSWMLSNIAVGVAMIPPVNWLMKKSRYSQSLQDTIVGKNIIEAESFIREIQEFKAD